MPDYFLKSKQLRSSPTETRPRLADGGEATTILTYVQQIRVGRAGRCPAVPILNINLFDNSGSVTGGNDPIGQRFLEVEFATAAVGRRCQCGKDLTATRHFDTPTSGDLDATPITEPNMAKIKRSLAVPPDGAGISCLGPSLRAAYAVAASHPHHRAVLVAYTDFQLFDNYLNEFIAFPGDVHAVVLRASPPQQLLAAPQITVTQIGHDSKPGTVARAVFTALTRTRLDAQALPPNPPTIGIPQ